MRKAPLAISDRRDDGTGAAQAQTREIRKDQQELNQAQRDLRNAQRYGDRRDNRDARRDVRDARQDLRESQRDWRRDALPELPRAVPLPAVQRRDAPQLRAQPAWDSRWGVPPPVVT